MVVGNSGWCHVLCCVGYRGDGDVVGPAAAVFRNSAQVIDYAPTPLGGYSKPSTVAAPTLVDELLHLLCCFC